MPLDQLLLLLVAGVGAGLVGYITGLASLVSYPVLLAVGLPPVTANITNTLGLVGAGIGTTARAGREFFAQGTRSAIWQVVISILGGIAGSGLLLATGESSFEVIVPWLVLVAALLVLLGPQLLRIRAVAQVPRWAYTAMLALTCVYGGYFGAGAGVIYMAVAVVVGRLPLPRAMLVKAILLGASNLAAAGVFIAFSPVRWDAVLVLALGCFAGGYLGPIVQRWFPDAVLRWLIGLAGIGLAVWLWWSATSF